MTNVSHTNVQLRLNKRCATLSLDVALLEAIHVFKPYFGYGITEKYTKFCCCVHVEAKADKKVANNISPVG